ncbi:MAG: hypothetical protein HOH38_14045 [Nitrospinaceae bacterium]|nr:hypothetical protein [Nitrospinaceae bacterium]
MIRINLHDYRYELRKIETQKRVVKCSAIIIAAVFLILVSWYLEQIRLDTVKAETKKLQSQVAALKKQVEKVKAMKDQTGRLETIIAGIENLRTTQVPASTLVGDLNILIPDDLWLSGIIQRSEKALKRKKIPSIMFGDPSQKKKKKRKKKGKEKQINEFLEVTGFSFSEKAVVEYVKRLQGLPYFDTVFLYQSLQVTGESKKKMKIKNVSSVYKFVLYCYMPGKEKKA